METYVELLKVLENHFQGKDWKKNYIPKFDVDLLEKYLLDK